MRCWNRSALTLALLSTSTLGIVLLPITSQSVEALVANIVKELPLISGSKALTRFGSHCMYLPCHTLQRVVVLDIIAVLCLRAALFMLMCAPHAAAGSVNLARNISV
nr:MAG TPA: hypothetical protein [Caudoviricetes sp.]